MRARLLGTLLLAGALLAGCSSEAEEPQALPSVSPSAAPSPTVAPVPSAAQQPTPQGAAAFARFFYSEVERAFAAKDPEIIRRLSAPDCGACDLFNRSLTSLRDNDERATDVSIDVVFAEAPAVEAPEARVDLIYNTIAVQRFDSAGKLIYEEPAVQNDEVQMTLVRDGETWLVREIEDA